MRSRIAIVESFKRSLEDRHLMVHLLDVSVREGRLTWQLRPSILLRADAVIQQVTCGVNEAAALFQAELDAQHEDTRELGNTDFAEVMRVQRAQGR